MDSWKARVYRWASIALRRIYQKVPIFGALPGGLAVIARGEKFLVIDRSDGLGYSFPGGFCNPFEDRARAVRREVLEETGLKVLSLQFLFDYKANVHCPVKVSVFRADAEGELRSSHEGTPVLATLDELQTRIIGDQRNVIRYLQEERGARS